MKKYLKSIYAAAAVRPGFTKNCPVVRVLQMAGADFKTACGGQWLVEVKPQRQSNVDSRDDDKIGSAYRTAFAQPLVSVVHPSPPTVFSMILLKEFYIASIFARIGEDWRNDDPKDSAND